MCSEGETVKGTKKGNTYRRQSHSLHTYRKKVLIQSALCFQVPDYNYDKPLFYYATMLMLENKIDVVHIHYSYDEQVMNKPMEEVTKIMMDDINPVMKEVLKGEQYNHTMFLGKSLGTIPIAT